MKKKIISQTIIFIFCVLFIIAFKTLFGDENVLVGVTVITATLMIMGRDLSMNMFKNTVSFIVINVMLGVLSYVSLFNVWTGIVCNFIAMFSIGILFCYNIRTSLYIPFGLQYVFMLSMPVSSSQISTRLLALAVGGIIIMLPQFLNKGKFKKVANSEIENIFNNLINKIDLIMDNKETKEVNFNVQKSINTLGNSIYSRRKEYFYINKISRIVLNMYTLLSKINLALNDVNADNINLYKDFLKDLKTQLLKIKNSYKNSENSSEITNGINGLIDSYKNCDKNKECIFEILNALNFLRKTFEKGYSLSDTEYNAINTFKDVNYTFKLKHRLKISLRKDSAKFCYALKVGIVVTVAGFITQYFKLEEGRWILFTVFSLTQPYFEQSRVKTIHRIKGTLIGVVVFLVLFSIVKSPLGRTGLVLLVGYVMGFTEEYDTKMIFITISALGAASLTAGSPEVMAFYRVSFIILGAIIASLANRFVLPYKIEDATRDLINNYFGLIKAMLHEINLALEKKENREYIRNLLLLSSLIEDKLISNNEISKNEYIQDFIENERNIALNIYYLFLVIKNKDVSEIVVNDINFIKEYTISENMIINNDFDFSLNKVETINDRLIVKNIKDIFFEIKNIKNIKANLA